MTVLRPYQRAAIDAVHGYWDNGGGNPLIDLATGTGKSVVHGQIIREIVEHNPDVRVLALTHVRELVQQNVQAALRVWPECPVGINAASLGRRDRRARVLFAAIQSVHREDATTLGPRHLILVDEAHLISRDGNGMYRKLIDRMREAVPDLRVLGLSATCYRLDSGRLDDGENRLFDDVVYSYGIGDGVRDGYLCPLVSRAGATEIDVAGVQRRGGEFVAGSLEEAARRPSVVVAACRDMVQRLQDRRSWLVFCSGVKHAAEVADQLSGMGIASACVTGDTPPGERAGILRDFKAGRIRALTNANVLTTGFDAPATDAIAMLRPTLSTGLYVQMLGRGTRLSPDTGKSNCLVLDYAGNVRRHGPVDAIDVRGGTKGSKGEAKTSIESVRAKACPRCEALVAIQARECVECGHEWPAEVKHEKRPDSEAAVMVREVEANWIKVQKVEVHVHSSRDPDKPSTLRVEYWHGISAHREWVCLDHPLGFARARAEAWWTTMTRQTSAEGVSVASAAEEIAEGMAAVDCIEIRVRRDDKYWRVTERKRADGSIVDEKFRIHRPIEERNAA